MRRPVRARFLASGLVVLGIAGLCAAAPRDRTFESSTRGIRIEAPAGWEVSTHTGYPSIAAVLVHPGGPRMSLSTAPTGAADARAAVAAHRPGLEAQGLRVLRIEPGARNGVDVVMLAPRRDEAVRQLYLVRPLGPGSQLVVVTLACSKAELAARATDFNFVVKRMTLTEPPRPPPDAAGGDRAEGEGTPPRPSGP